IHGYSDFLFGHSTARRDVLESSKFRSIRNGKLQFQLRIHPKGHTDTDNGYNSVYVVYSTVNRIDVTIQLVLAIVDEDGDKRFTKSMFIGFALKISKNKESAKRIRDHSQITSVAG